MIKKIIIFTILAAIIGGVGYLFYISTEIGKLAPELMQGTRQQFIEVCEYEYKCINAVEEHFDDCRLDNYMTGLHMLNFQEKYLQFILNTQKCIETKADYELPSFMDYIMEEKLAEIENNSQDTEETHDSKFRALTGSETLEELLLYKDNLEAYRKYKGEGAHKAFAANGLGSYGWSANYETENLATNSAIEYCEQNNQSSKNKCFIIDINGKFIYPTKNEKSL